MTPNPPQHPEGDAVATHPLIEVPPVEDLRTELAAAHRRITELERLHEQAVLALSATARAWFADAVRACRHELHGADGGRCPGCGWDSHPVPTGPAPVPELGLPAMPVLSNEFEDAR